MMQRVPKADNVTISYCGKEINGSFSCVITSSKYIIVLALSDNLVHNFSAS